MSDWKSHPISDGTARANRGLKALEPEYVNVDELLYEELLSMGVGIASSIHFRNLNNQIDGDWGDLFTADEAVIMAMIVSTNPQRLEREFNAIHTNHYASQLKYIMALARKVDFWLSKLNLSRHYSSQLLAQKIVSLIDTQLMPALHQCISLHQALNGEGKRQSLYEISDFSSFWGLDGLDTFDECNTSKKSYRYQISYLFHSFNKAIDHLITITPKQLKSSLSGGHHEPAIALFMVFLRLYQRAQEKVNSFTERHLRFYYDEVLNTGKYQCVPPSAYLQLSKVPGSDKVLIEKGSLFSAGKDKEKREVIYHADNSLVVTDATVSSVATLYLQKDTLVSPECELDHVTRIKSYCHSHDEIADMSAKSPLPIFGADSANSTASSNRDARIGFAISDPVLKLTQGRRDVSLQVHFIPSSSDDTEAILSSMEQSTNINCFRQQCGNLFSAYLLSGEQTLSNNQKTRLIKCAERMLAKESADEIALLFTQDWQGLFYKLFNKVFEISITGKNGWIDIQNYSITPNDYGSSILSSGFSISFTLLHSVDAIVSLSKTVHGDEFAVDNPVLRCLLSSQANFFPYTLLSGLSLEKVDIEVNVEGITNIAAYNEHGQLDITKPFQPFGPIPSHSSQFIFGSQELSTKRVIDLSLDLEWARLPSDSGGFTSLYKSYEGDYHNEHFKCKVEALSEGEWGPYDQEAAITRKMFAYDVISSKLKPKVRLELTDVTNYTGVTSSPDINSGKYRYTTESRNGFFRLWQTSPEGSFGHDEYPKLLAATLSLNARIKSLKKLKPIPNQPYTPVLNSLSINYRARSSIDMTHQSAERTQESGKLFHLHPFGISAVSPLTEQPLLPVYKEQGNVLIGLKSLDITGDLTLYFQLTKEGDNTKQIKDAEVAWYYLSHHGWKELPAKCVLSDTTNNFIASGVVTLNLPEDMSARNPMMPVDQYWIRASTKTHAQYFPKLMAIKPHTLKVTHYQESNNGSHHITYDKNKWTILQAIPGISAVKQAGDLYGGRDKELDAARYTRISERLHHKNRASSPWDYEHLLLEKFPDIEKVKCFPSTSSRGPVNRAGSVLVVVVPSQKLMSASACRKLHLDQGKLFQIKSYLKNKTSPFVKIEVINPVYEMVQIRCKVKFKRNEMSGGYHKQLDQALSEFICPWSSRGYNGRFGWSFRKKDVESYIRSLEYVDYVTEVSMLHITTQDGMQYCMTDTAKQTESVAVSPQYPWSLPIPAERHFIETTNEVRGRVADITGINELEVGSTFIIDGGCSNG